MKRLVQVTAIFIGVICCILLPGGRYVRPAAAAGSITVSPGPINLDFEMPASDLSTRPVNYDFASGALSPWTVSSGSATVFASGTDYAAKSTANTTMDSSTFTVPPDAQLLRWDHSYLGGGNDAYDFQVVESGTASFLMPNVSAPTGTWETRYLNISAWENHTINLRFTNWGSGVAIDNVGILSVVVPNWQVAGPTASTLTGASGGPFGNYVQLSGTASITSTAFLLPNLPPLLDYYRRFDAGSNGLYVYLLNDDDGSVAGLFNTESGGADSWTERNTQITGLVNYHNGPVKIQFQASGGLVDIDVAANALTSGTFNGPSASTKDPVNTSTGDFVHSHTDLAVPGIGLSLDFTRYYHSSGSQDGPVGEYWTYTYGASLSFNADSSVTVLYPDGHTANFTWSGSSYVAPAGTFDAFAHNGGDGTYTLTTHDQIRYNFTSVGVLSSILDRNSNSISLTYTSGQLTTVTDVGTDSSGNRTLTIAWTGSHIHTVTDQLSRVVTFHYNSTGDLDQVTDTKGNITYYGYDAGGHHLQTITDSNGVGHTSVTNAYDSAGRVAEQLGANGGTTCIYYGVGPPYTSTHCLGVSPAPATAETIVVDPLTNKTTYTRDALFRTTDIKDTQGGLTHYDYDPSNNVTCVTDPDTHRTGFAYLSGNRTQVIDANNTDPTASTCQLKSNGVSWQYTYDSLNDMRHQTDPLGNLTDHIYAAGNLTRIVREDSGLTVRALTCFERAGTGQLTALVQSTDLVVPSGPTDPCTGPKTQFAYASSGDLTSMIIPRFSNQPSVDTDNDSLGQTATSTSGPCSTGGAVQPRFRDCIENFVGTDPARACAATPTANDEPVDAMPADLNDDQKVDVTDRTLMEIATEVGKPYNQRYDLNADGAVNVLDKTIVSIYISKTMGVRCSQTFAYDVVGRLLTATNELGQTTTYTYDAQNKLLTQKDNLNNTTSYTYDNKGNLKTVTDANRQQVGSTSEADISNACGTLGTGNGVNDDPSDDNVIDDGCPNTIYNYDNADRLTSVVDALGHVTSYAYDKNGNLTSVTQANRQQVGSTSEANISNACGTLGTGNGVNDDPSDDNVIDDGCPSTIYAYDALNRLQSTTDALAHVTAYTYDAASNLQTMTDPRGIVVTYTPDALNRLHTMASSTGETVTYDYDAAGNRQDMVDVNGTASGTTTYTYGDGLNRLTQVDVTYPAANTVKYNYDAVGNISRLTYPDTTSYVTYAYNADHTMSSVQQSWGSVGATNYTYNKAGNLTNTTLPNGAWTDFGYDNADRLTSAANKQPGPTTMSSYTYTLDKVGNRSQMTDSNSNVQTYKYDPLYRLKEADYPGSVVDAYSYDADGNRLTKNTTSYTYDAADELTQAGGLAYGYGSDGNNGNLATRGSDTFTFNYANQLTQTVIGGVTSASVYNGDGLRMKHTVDVTGTPVTANYVWDVNRSVPEILQDGTNTYVYGLGRISSTDGSGNQTYYDADGLGSTADLTNSSATKTDGYTYDVFGTPTHTSGSSTNAFQFTGQQTDAESGLQYLRARYYDPSTGRFLSQDPVAGLAQVPQTQNRYPYALNNPTTFDDPTGQICHSIGGCFNSVAGAASDVVTAAAPVVFQCVTWGAVGLAASGNPVGAGVGCAAGSVSYLVGQYLISNPLSECSTWGAAGYATFGSVAGLAGGCVAGTASWFDNKWGWGTPLSQCTAWGAPAVAFGSGIWRWSGAIAGCVGGALTNAVLNDNASSLRSGPRLLSQGHGIIKE